MNPRRRILIIAEAANPEWVSVPLVGWSLAAALKRREDVHVVTQIRNRDAFLRAGWIEGEDFTAIDSEAVARPMWKLGEILRMGQGKGWTILQAIAALTYPYFERLVWRRFGADIRAGKFDIVHRVTPLSPTISSSLAGKCARAGIPFVLGPLNGGVPWPKGFDAERRREREWLSYFRSVYKLLPGRNATARNAAAILCGSRHTMSEMPRAVTDKLIYMPENAIDPTRFHQRAEHKSEILRACFIGRLVPYKGADMLIEAAAPLLRKARMGLDIVGDGPMMQALQAQADALGVADQITFHGWLPHEQVQTVLSQATLFAFPSVREFGGGVVLEAMALGVPPLIVDYAGPGELVHDGLGFKVPIGKRADIVSGFQGALEQLSRHPELLRATGARAQDHVAQNFTWDAKAAQVSRVYDHVLADVAVTSEVTA